MKSLVALDETLIKALLTAADEKLDRHVDIVTAEVVEDALTLREARRQLSVSLAMLDDARRRGDA